MAASRNTPIIRSGFFYLARTSSTPSLNTASTGTIIYDPFTSDATAVKASNVQAYLGTTASSIASALPKAKSQLNITTVSLSPNSVQGGPTALDVLAAALAPIAPELGIVGLSGDVTGAAATVAGAGLFAAAGDSITSVLDFLKLIAWLFHPRNVLRAVEFLVGIALMIFGFNAALQARGERVEGFSTSEGVITRSGLGRVATELGRAASGGGGGSSGRRPERPRSAPHRTRQRALTQRYRREEDLQRRRAKAPRSKKTNK